MEVKTNLTEKIDLYTHVPLSFSLSATLVSDDDFLNRMYEIAYPVVTRYAGPAYSKYISAKAIIYRFDQPNQIRTTDFGLRTYSHHAFEKSVIRRPQVLTNYLDMVKAIVKRGWKSATYQSGDRCLVYASSINLCTIMAQHLQRAFPDVKVKRYVEDDPYENLMEADITVSTPGSAGTGVDIPQLTTVVLTPALASTAANIQGFGRLRKLKDGRTPEFYYLVCEDFKKHIEYHERKRKLLLDRALTYKAEFYGQQL